MKLIQWSADTRRIWRIKTQPTLDHPVEDEPLISTNLQLRHIEILGDSTCLMTEPYNVSSTPLQWQYLLRSQKGSTTILYLLFWAYRPTTTGHEGLLLPYQQYSTIMWGWVTFVFQSTPFTWRSTITTGFTWSKFDSQVTTTLSLHLTMQTPPWQQYTDTSLCALVNSRLDGKLASPSLPSRTVPVAFIFMSRSWSINAYDVKSYRNTVCAFHFNHINQAMHNVIRDLLAIWSICLATCSRFLLDTDIRRTSIASTVYNQSI